MSLWDKMLAVIADVNAQLAEREELVGMIAIALLSRKNLFVLGEPGQAKSAAINCFRSRIEGARQFERLLSKQTDEDQLFGRIDLASLIPGSVPEAYLKGDPSYEGMKLELECALSELAQYPDSEDAQRKVDLLTEKLETSCDNEVLRVLRMMPKWQAGMMNAKPCRTKVCIPVVFNL